MCLRVPERAQTALRGTIPRRMKKRVENSASGPAEALPGPVARTYKESSAAGVPEPEQRRPSARDDGQKLRKERYDLKLRQLDRPHEPNTRRFQQKPPGIRDDPVPKWPTALTPLTVAQPTRGLCACVRKPRGTGPN